MKKLLFIFVILCSGQIMANDKNICLGNYLFALPQELTPLENFNTKYRFNNIFVLKSQNYQEIIDNINQKAQDKILNQDYGDNFYILTTREEDYIKAIAVINFTNDIVIVENNKNYMYDGYNEADNILQEQYNKDFNVMYAQFREFIADIKPKKSEEFCLHPSYSINPKTLKNQKLNIFYRKKSDNYLFGIGVSERKDNNKYYNMYLNKNKEILDINIANLAGKLILDNENDKHIRHTWVYFNKENNILTEIFLQNSNNKDIGKNILKQEFIKILNSFKLNNSDY